MRANRKIEGTKLRAIAESTMASKTKLDLLRAGFVPPDPERSTSQQKNEGTKLRAIAESRTVSKTEPNLRGGGFVPPEPGRSASQQKNEGTKLRAIAESRTASKTKLDLRGAASCRLIRGEARANRKMKEQSWELLRNQQRFQKRSWISPWRRLRAS
jgi:hypothetical protein